MFLLAVFAAVYVGSMFSPALLDDADATHAEAAREMAATGDYVTLHVNGIRYLEKAPLMYWLVAWSFKLFGVSAAAARLPMVLSVLLLAVLAWKWSRRAFGDSAAEYSALFMLTAAGVFLFTRILIPDLLLALFIAASLYFFMTALEDRSAWRWYAGYSACALAVLTKGLVALVFIGGAAFLYLAWTRDWRRWREFRLLTGIALLLAIAAPWHILAGVRNPGFFWFYFVNEHFLRFLGKRYPRDYNKLPALAYWGLHLAWLFPWSMFVAVLFRRERGAPRDFASRTRVMCWLLAGLVLVFFSLSTNQEYYTLPAYLPLLMLIADAIARAEQQPASRKTLIVSTGVIAIIGSASALALAAGLWRARDIAFVPDIGSVLVERGVGNYTLSMSHFFDLTSGAFAALRLPAALAAAALLVAPIAALWLQFRNHARPAILTLAAGMAVVLVASHLALARFEPYLSSRPLAQAVEPLIRPEDKLVIYGDFSYGSSLTFYLHGQVWLVNGRTTSLEFGSRFPDAPPIFWDDAQLAREWSGGTRLFLFASRERREDVERLALQPRFLIAESSGKRVYSNRAR
jgi:hypothetical protein